MDEAGGRGIAVQVDHLVPDAVGALVARIEGEQGGLHVLVNNIWGATTMEWNKSVWESSLETGLRTLRLAVNTHAITSHFAIPLLIKTPGGLVVEVTDGTAEYNATNYRVSFFYDLAKAAVNRMAFALAHELSPTARRPSHSLRGGFDQRPCSKPTKSPNRTGVTRQRARPTSPSPKAQRSSAGPWRRSQRPQRVALERKVTVQRATGEDLRLYRSRRQPTRCLEVRHRSSGRRQTRRRDRLSLTPAADQSRASAGLVLRYRVVTATSRRETVTAALATFVQADAFF